MIIIPIELYDMFDDFVSNVLGSRITKTNTAEELGRFMLDYEIFVQMRWTLDKKNFTLVTGVPENLNYLQELWHVTLTKGIEDEGIHEPD